MNACPECVHFPGTLEALVGWSHFHTPAACWELLHLVYRRHLGIVLPYEGVLVPRRRWRQLVDEGRAAHEGRTWRRVDGPSATYDGIFFRFDRLDHVGLALNASEMIHVPTGTAGVCRSPIDRYTVKADIFGVYRYIR